MAGTTILVPADPEAPGGGPMQIGDGTAAAPAYSFLADTDTGIYRIGSNSLGISAGGTLRLTIDSTGVVTASSGFKAAAGGAHSFNGRTQLTSGADGNLALLNAAGTAFSLLQLGGTSASFPAIKRNSTALNLRLADDSADAAVTAAAGTFSGAVTGPDGAAATPGLRLTSEATGLFLSGAGVLGLGVAGASKATLNSSGVFAASSGFQAATAGAYTFASSSQIQGGTDGTLTLLNAAGSAFSFLQFGGTSSSFPALKRSTTNLSARLADDSADTNFTAATLVGSGAGSSSAATVQVVQAGLGLYQVSSNNLGITANNVLQILVGSNSAQFNSNANTVTGSNGFSNFGASYLFCQGASASVTCSGATSDASNIIPAGSIVWAVTTRVSTAITGATSYSVGDGTTATLWGSTLAIAQGTTSNMTNYSGSTSVPYFTTSAKSVRLTANGSNFTGGVVRVIVYYSVVNAPTS